METTLVAELEQDRPPMVAALSPSSIATWKQCPKRFFYEKILRLETEPGLEAVCGSFVHEVLEHLMELPAAERLPDTARQVAAARWATFVTDPASRFAELGLDEAGVLAFKRRAWTGITGYFAIENPALVDVVATEQQMQAELAGAPIFGIVDRLERAGDRLVVSDYKTGKAPKWQDEIDEKLEQLHLYAAMLDALGTPVSTLRLLFVSPQLGALAKAARCRETAEAATARLAAAVPDMPNHKVLAAIAHVDEAARAARVAALAPAAGQAAADAEDGGSRADRARAAAAEAAMGASMELAGTAALAPLILDACAARKRAYFAGRDAERARPTEITLEVGPEHVEAARIEVARVWSEASACSESWDFPATTGVLCDWCPFRDRCDGFAAWDAAGRPAPSLPVG
ncbi:MAG: hypothetical protein NVS1B12_04210 [Acidimicrobiales bacterium]